MVEVTTNICEAFFISSSEEEGPCQGRKEVWRSMDGRIYEIVKVSSCNLVKSVRIEIKI